MVNKLELLKAKVTGKYRSSEDSIITSLYILSKEIHNLGDLIGREFDIIYKGDKPIKIIQKPIKLPTLMLMINEIEKDYKRQEREIEKSKRRR